MAGSAVDAGVGAGVARSRSEAVFIMCRTGVEPTGNYWSVVRRRWPRGRS
ncbi:MAG TPA: hypothetical protein VIK73_04910 [Limnochordales bacterium]